MFPAWRLQIREARHAVDDGRWDDAAEMLSDNGLRRYLPAKRLSMKLASRLVQRAEQRIGGGESSAGWRDLNRAELLGGDDAAISAIRQTQTQQRLDGAIQILEQGDAAAAARRLAHMERRGLGGSQRIQWQQVAKIASEAERNALHGRFDAAAAQLDRARTQAPVDSRAPVSESLQQRRDAYREAAIRLTQLETELHATLSQGNWTMALQAADSILRLAPQHTAAQQARRRAWKAVGMDATQEFRPQAGKPAFHSPKDRQPAPSGGSTRRQAANAKEDTVSLSRAPGKRLVTWIDAVGGFLICLGDEIVLGQPSADGGVDVPLLADLSRRHATIVREGESYILHPIHQATVNDVAAAGPIVLRDNSVIGLGESVKLRFRRPHALSATAVLQIMTHHKTEPAVDGIVLMSDSCIIGSQGHSHIRCRDWEHEVVLFRRGDQLICRTQAEAEFDGRPMPSQVEVRQDCRIEGEDFALSFEEI